MWVRASVCACVRNRPRPPHTTPAQLAAVVDFEVYVPDVGAVRWLEPVDVRGLDLDELVVIGTDGGQPFVEVYPEPCPHKPARGSGLPD